MRRLLLPLCLLLLCLSGCKTATGPSETLTVLAGSELKDLSPLFGMIRKQTGIELKMEYIGTLEGAERLASGARPDLAWFSHGKYLSLLPQTKSLIHAQDKIMLSPVILGIKRSKVQSWGWLDGRTIRWSDIAEKAAGGELRFAMTNPASSNTGFTALLGVAAAFSKNTGALTSADVDKEQLLRFFAGQKLTAGSSGWLAEAFIREQDRLDALINYESVLMTLNGSGALAEPLELIYPQEGIVTADYPLMLINKDKREAYTRLVRYLTSKEFQQQIMERTYRRPVIPQVRLSSDFPGKILVELPFPSDLATIDNLIFAYFDEVRPPSSPIFLLDVSGSMQGNRIDNLRTSIKNFTGLDTSLTGRFARFRLREEVRLIPFNHEVLPPRVFNIDNNDQHSPAMEEIRRYVDSLNAGGGTAIYATLMEAYRIAGEQKRLHPERYRSIVLLTDGKNEHKVGFDDFAAFYRDLPKETREIKTFTILFGGGNVDEMLKVADMTGGRMFDGQKTSLAEVFKDIRGYQ